MSRRAQRQGREKNGFCLKSMAWQNRAVLASKPRFIYVPGFMIISKRAMP
jgi:hypothetical protein